MPESIPIPTKVGGQKGAGGKVRAILRDRAVLS